LCSLGLILASDDVRPDKKVTLRLRASPSGGSDEAVSAVPAADLVDGSWTWFDFEPLRGSAGRRYYAVVESDARPDERGPTVAVCRSDVFGGGRTYLDGRIAEHTLSFRTLAKPAVLPDDLPGADHWALDPVYARLSALGVEMQATQEDLTRLNATLPIRALRAAGRLLRRAPPSGAAR
jgi:hypothetical protein